MTVCKKCGGTGEINVPVTEHLGTVLYGKEQCDECNGTGEVDPTNEEWLHTLNTEQFAEKLTDFAFWLIPYLPTEDKREQIKQRIVEWLKEKRDEM